MNIKAWKLNVEQHHTKHNKHKQLSQIHMVLMMEFTPPGLHLLVPASMTWAFVLASIMQNCCLQSHVSSATYSNGSKTLKYTKNDSSCTPFGRKLPHLWQKLIFPTILPPNLEN